MPVESWQTRNPHCRKHRLQSWQQIHHSLSKSGVESKYWMISCTRARYLILEYCSSNPHCRKHKLQSWPQTRLSRCMERACCIGSLTACKTCRLNQQTGNPHCRTRRLQSWQQIHPSKYSESACCIGFLTACKTCQWCWQTLAIHTATSTGFRVGSRSVRKVHGRVLAHRFSDCLQTCGAGRLQSTLPQAQASELVRGSRLTRSS